MANTSSRKKGYPTAAFSTVFNDSRAYETDKRSFAEIKFEPRLSSDKSATLRFYYDDYTYIGNYPTDYPLEDPPVVGLNQDNSEGNWWGGDAHLEWDITSANKLIAGTEYQSHTKVFMQNFRVDS
jgi:iron complex outermembrane receptor protein